MESTGARLKKIRLEKGITLEDAQKGTKINLEILKSLEDDSLSNINPVYIKGFLKIYCVFLGVEPGEYLPGYKDNGPVIQQAKREKDDSLFWGEAAKKPFIKPQVAVIIVLAAGVLFLSLGTIKLAGFFGSKMSESRKAHARLVLPKPAKKAKNARQQARAKTAVTVYSTVNKIAVPAPAAASAENSQPGVRIGLHAIDDCWVQTKLDGKIIFQNVLKRGRFESWSAKNKAELSLGSAGAVRLEINGKLIPSLGRKGQVLKNILITKDGLKVGK